MKECCIFKKSNAKEAYLSADFEELETLSHKSGETFCGNEYSECVELVRCKKCGAICVKAYNYEFGSCWPDGDAYCTVYFAVTDAEDAKKLADVNPYFPAGRGRHYVREISREFGGVEYDRE